MKLLSETEGLARAQPWLGTLVGIRIRDAGACADAQAAIAAAFAAVRRVHELMSFHDPESEVCELNRRAAQQAVDVSPWTFEVLMRAVEFSEASAGVFDCAVAPELVRTGFLPAPASCDLAEFPAGPNPGCFHEQVEFLPQQRIRFKTAMLIDLGGIAKGFAVDRAVDALRDHGIAAASVNAGGDLRVFGEVAETIFVRLPRDLSSVIPLASLHDAALATSADYGNRPARSPSGRSTTPFIDSRSGACCGRGISVSVSAPDCVTADALTKVVLVTEDEHHPALEAFGASAIILPGDAGRTGRS